jgi:hypothetical protein
MNVRSTQIVLVIGVPCVVVTLMGMSGLWFPVSLLSLVFAVGYRLCPRYTIA